MSADKVHEPSPIQLLRAREDGLVARSSELTRSVVVCSIMGSALLFAGSAQQLFQKSIRSSFSNIQLRLSATDSAGLLQDMIQLLIPFVSFLLIVGIAGMIIWNLQSPLFPRFNKVAPDLNRSFDASRLLAPFSIDRWLRAGTAFLLFASLLGAGSLWFVMHYDSLIEMMRFDLATGLRIAGKFLNAAMFATGAILLLFGILDYIRERIHVHGKLRMTEEERREEAREQELNPAWRRRLQERS